jgi:hypothetical protein
MKNTNWSDRSRQVLFGCEHQHRETERRGNEHFDKHALREIDIRCGNRTRRRASDMVSDQNEGASEQREAVLISDRTRCKGENDCSRGDGARQLGNTVKYEPHRADGADEKQSKADIWVEKPARGAKEKPDGYEQAQPKGSCNVERLLETRALHFVRALHPAVSEQ